MSKKVGYVCPEWAKPHWNANECTVQQCTDGTYIVLDHSLNGVVVYAGRTQSHCQTWLKDGNARGESNPNAPYRVYGLDDECHEFDMPFDSFVKAVKAYCESSRGLCMVFIKGVSPAVKAHLIALQSTLPTKK